MSAPLVPFRLGPQLVRVLLADLGLRPADVLRAAQLPGDLFGRDVALLSAAQYYALFDALDELTGERELATLIADMLSPEVFDPPLFAAMCSPNLQVAAERIALHKRLISPMRLTATLDADGVDLEIIWPAGDPPPAVLTCIEATFWVALARQGTRTRVIPQRVVVPRLPRNVAAIEGWLGARVRQGDATQVRFSRLDAARPFLTANAGMWAFFEPELRRRLDELDGSATTGSRVRAALVELLPAGAGTMQGVAHQLAISTRTLQRRLGDEGVTFQALLADVREQLARHYLTTSALSLGEIAFLLGYDNPSSFHRAFNQWTGRTPRGVRAAAGG